MNVGDRVRFRDTTLEHYRTRQDFISAFGEDPKNEFEITKMNSPVPGQCCLAPSNRPTWGWYINSLELYKFDDLFE